MGRSAISEAHLRKGIGTVLLVAAAGRILDIFNSAGGIGMFVDAKDGDAKRYYDQLAILRYHASRNCACRSRRARMRCQEQNSTRGTLF